MSSTKSLPERADAVYRQLRSMRRRFRVGGWITLIVGVLLIVLVASYFTFGYLQIAEFQDPEYIVSLVGQTVDQQIPLLRQRIESEVKSGAPVWAEQASQQVLEQIPAAREQLEHAALVQADKAIAKIDVLGEKKFREIIDENRQTVQQAIDQLKDDEEISEEVVQGLQLALEKELQVSADVQADAVQAIVGDLHEAMKKLHEGKDLTEEQKAERRVLMLARRWQQETFPNAKFDVSQAEKHLGLGAVKTIVEQKETQRVQDEVKKDDTEPAPAQPSEEKAAPAEEKKPAEEAKPEKKAADQPEAEKEAPAEEKPADKPAEEAKPEAKPAEQPEAEKAAAPEEKPADQPKEDAKPAEKPDEPAPADDKPEE